MKTIHLSEAPKMAKISFPAVKLSEVKRTAPESAEAKFHCHVPAKNIEQLFTHMGWQIPGETSSMEKLDGRLKDGNLIFTAKLDDETVSKLKLKSPDGHFDSEFQVDLEFKQIDSFACHRFEREGHKGGNKGKGFRRELRFTCTFGPRCEDAAANLEAYMMRTDNARGTLQVKYLIEEKQGELNLTDDKQESLVPDDVEATEEQIEATKEIETGTLASSRQMGGRRGRLADKAAN